MIVRQVDIGKRIRKGKTLLVFGPRRIGKSVLVEEFVKKTTGKKTLLLQGDNLSVQNALSRNDIADLEKIVGGYDILAIDEAQYIKNIAKSLKILNDQMPSLSVVATGSSSFDLRGQLAEPLLGRKNTIFLYPFSFGEIIENAHSPDPFMVEEYMNRMLVYGSYPDSFLSKNDAERADFLSEIVESLLFKDILTFQEVKNSNVIFKLLSLIAHQVGSEVSFNELASKLGINKLTVERYIDLLEKAFIVFRLPTFSRNLRKEIVQNKKFYFYDLGIRNAVINNFAPLDARNDIGDLWENFCLIERMKQNAYAGIKVNAYFWRTYGGAEIDYIEERGGKLFPYEFKYRAEKVKRAAKAFVKEYGTGDIELINREHFYPEFVKPPKRADKSSS